VYYRGNLSVLKDVFLLKEGEIALKGLNRKSFEHILSRNIKNALAPYGRPKVSVRQSVIRAEAVGDGDSDEIFAALMKVFGIAAVCRCKVCEKDLSKIAETAIPFISETAKFAKTFKVEAKRADKAFPLDSYGICREMGGIVLEHYPHLGVNVKNPDFILNVEIREDAAYIHLGNIAAAGGLPVGSSGKALLLLSGGIDSPVAGYMTAKRGVKISAVHFEAPPYTSPRALQKVQTLAKIMSGYTGDIDFYTVPFTAIQEKIRDNCFEEYFTIIMRRLMMKIACKIANENGMQAIITGESIGQVASQTMYALRCTDAVSDLPVFRPVIGMDKTEITEIARKIGTFETSIEPYEDCCTVFTPKHPKTRPELAEVEEIERAFDFEPYIEEAIKNTTLINININEQ
jgi:thiamine biosynthesis protein ThiI